MVVIGGVVVVVVVDVGVIVVVVIVIVIVDGRSGRADRGVRVQACIAAPGERGDGGFL